MTMPLISESEFTHKSVLLREVVDAVAPQPGGIYLDLTAGGGGHSRAILERCEDARVIAVDRDESAVVAARAALGKYGERANVVHGRFGEIESIMVELGVPQVDGMIADLGISSPQLDRAERGMSFRSEGPLDMRMDRTQGETALEMIRRMTQDELADAIYQFGEERRSRRVARCIKQALAAGELENTSQLRRAIVRAVGPRRVGGVDPATRTFQALRISVNDELGELRQALSSAARLVRPGGMAVFISFHSLEDRLVKRAFLDAQVWERIHKKPLGPSEEEQSENPRSRSAKLRAARRTQGVTLLEHGREEFDSDG